MRFFRIHPEWLPKLATVATTAEDGLYTMTAVINGIRWESVIDRLGWAVASPEPNPAQTQAMIRELIVLVVSGAAA